MLHRLRPRLPSPAMVVALVALMVAMGGTGYAVTALPKNSVASKSIKKNAVTTAKIKNGNVKAADVGANAVDGSKVKDDSLTGADISEGSLGKVPAAANADAATNATNATNAGNADKIDGKDSGDFATAAQVGGASIRSIKFIADTTTGLPVANAVLFDSDGLQILGNCDAAGELSVIAQSNRDNGDIHVDGQTSADQGSADSVSPSGDTFFDDQGGDFYREDDTFDIGNNVTLSEETNAFGDSQIVHVAFSTEAGKPISMDLLIEEDTLTPTGGTSRDCVVIGTAIIG